MVSVFKLQSAAEQRGKRVFYSRNTQQRRRSRLQILSSDGLTGSSLGIWDLGELTNLCFSHKISSSVHLWVADGGRASTGEQFPSLRELIPNILTGDSIVRFLPPLFSSPL